MELIDKFSNEHLDLFEIVARKSREDITHNQKMCLLQIVKELGCSYVEVAELVGLKSSDLTNWNRALNVVPLRKSFPNRRPPEPKRRLEDMTLAELKGIIEKQKDQLAKAELIKEIEANKKLLLEVRK